MVPIIPLNERLESAARANKSRQKAGIPLKKAPLHPRQRSAVSRRRTFTSLINPLRSRATFRTASSVSLRSAAYGDTERKATDEPCSDQCDASERIGSGIHDQMIVHKQVNIFNHILPALSFSVPLCLCVSVVNHPGVFGNSCLPAENPRKNQRRHNRCIRFYDKFRSIEG